MTYYTYILNQLQFDNPAETKWTIQYITTIDEKNFESQLLNVNIELPNSLYYLLCKSLLDTLNTTDQTNQADSSKTSKTTLLMANVNELNTKDITQKVTDMYTSYYTQIMNLNKDQESVFSRIGMIEHTLKNLQSLFQSFDRVVYGHREPTPMNPKSELPVSHYFLFSTKKIPFHAMEQMKLYHPESKELLHFVDNQPNTYETIQPKLDTLKRKLEGLLHLTEQFDEHANVFANDLDVNQSDNILSNTFKGVSLQTGLEEELNDVIPYNEYMNTYELNDFDSVYKNPFEAIEKDLTDTIKGQSPIEFNHSINKILNIQYEADKATQSNQTSGIDFDTMSHTEHSTAHRDHESESIFSKLKKMVFSESEAKDNQEENGENGDDDENYEDDSAGYLFAIYGLYDKKTTIVSDSMIVRSSLESLFTCPQLQKLFHVRVYKFKATSEHKRLSLFSDLVKNTVYDTFECMCEDIDTFNRTDTITESFLEEFVKKNYALDNNKLNKIKYTELYKSVIACMEESNITLGQESKNMIKYKLSGILSNLKLTKFRSSDGIYWYGIRRKQVHAMRCRSILNKIQ